MRKHVKETPWWQVILNAIAIFAIAFVVVKVLGGEILFRQWSAVIANWPALAFFFAAVLLFVEKYVGQKLRRRLEIASLVLMAVGVVLLMVRI